MATWPARNFSMEGHNAAMHFYRERETTVLFRRIDSGNPPCGWFYEDINSHGSIALEDFQFEIFDTPWERIMAPSTMKRVKFFYNNELHNADWTTSSNTTEIPISPLLPRPSDIIQRSQSLIQFYAVNISPVFQSPTNSLYVHSFTSLKHNIPINFYQFILLSIADHLIPFSAFDWWTFIFFSLITIKFHKAYNSFE